MNKRKREFEQTMCIYAISFNGSDKVYIGRTTNLSSRMYQHFSSLKRGVCASAKLQEEYNKYGRSLMIVAIIEVISKKSELKEREVYWIKKKNSVEKGLNMVEDDKSNLGKKFSEDHKRKIGQANKGNKRPDFSEFLKEYNKNKTGENNNFYGRKHTEESKQKIRDTKAKNKLLKAKNVTS